MPTLPFPNALKFDPAPEGSHAAVCSRIVDLGTEPSNLHGKSRTNRKVSLSFELRCEERRRSGQPFMITKVYNWSTNDNAALRSDLEAWRGRAFDRFDFGPGGYCIEVLIGKPCLLSVTHEREHGATHPRISGITRLPRSMSTGTPELETLFVWLDASEFDPLAFDKLPVRLKERIRKTEEYQSVLQHLSQRRLSPLYDNAFDTNIPF
jgi:hypothetical protein